MNWKLLLVLGVTAACLAWVLQGLDVGEVRGAAAGFAWWVFAPMAGFYLLAHLVRVWRLGTLLHAPVPFRRLLSVNTIGFLAINVMPLRLGELVRPYLLWDRDRIGLARSLPAILVERLLDFGMLLAMLLLAGSLPLVQEPRVVLAVVLHAGQLGFTVVLGTTFLLAEGASLLDLVRKSRRLAGDGTSREPVEAE